MIAVDSNILVYAHREESIWWARAAGLVQELARGPAAWAIPWPCIHEFLSVTTHRKIFLPPTPHDKALEQIEIWMEAPGLVLLSESGSHWKELKTLVLAGKIIGPRIHDARIAALCLQHGIAELWTADRDFSRFPALKTRNPLVD